ncbi:MAG: PorV/PorQ family protein [Candidatus Eisenbacteria bacterium]
MARSTSYRTILLASLLLAALVTPAGAANKYAGEFLTHGVGARALGMGSAFVAVANDVTAGYWNPAGVTDVDGRAVQLMHAETFGDVVNYDTGAYVHPLDGDAALAVTIVRLAVDDIPFTDFDEDEERIYYDAARITLESDSETAMLVTYGRRLTDRLRVGGNLKLITKSIANYTCYGAGFDLGAKFDVWEGTTVGANLQDVTTTFLSWDTKERELIMPTAKLGVAQAFDLPSMGGVLTLAADADFRFENRALADQYHLGSVSADTHYGAEFVYREKVGVRGGFSMGQLTAGAGLSLAGFTVDYAFGKHEYLESSHRVSAAYSF